MQYNELLEKQIIGRLRLDNPWWTEKEIAPFYAQMHPRLYLDIFYPLVAESDLRRAIILMEPRRVCLEQQWRIQGAGWFVRNLRAGRREKRR